MGTSIPDGVSVDTQDYYQLAGDLSRENGEIGIWEQLCRGCKRHLPLEEAVSAAQFFKDIKIQGAQKQGVKSDTSLRFRDSSVLKKDTRSKVCTVTLES